MSHAPSSPRRLGRWLGIMLGRAVEPDTPPAVPPPLFAHAPEPVLPEPVLPEPVLLEADVPDTDVPDADAGATTWRPMPVHATLISDDHEMDGVMFSPEVSLRIEAARIVAASWDASTRGNTADGAPAARSRRQLYLAIEDMARFLETGDVAGPRPSKDAA